MAMTASCKLINNTGSMILFTSITQVNDDATWDVNPPAGTQIQDGSSTLIAMGNSSVFFAPQGVGFSAQFVCQSNFQPGGVSLDDPAVGEHSFSLGNTARFNYQITNPQGNDYQVVISLK